MKIEPFLHDGLGRIKILLDEVDSTQNFASQLIKESKLSQGTLILARQQTQGQGRLGKSWSSQVAENFTGSLFLKHDWKFPPNPFLLSKIAALAVRDTVEWVSGQTCFIKWPNDLIVRHKKISGILVSNQWKGNYWESSIVGMGINVNQQQFKYNLPHAISIFQVTGEKTDINIIVDKLMHHFNLYYNQLLQGKLDFIEAAYFNCLYGVRELVHFKIHQTDQVFQGLILEVNSSGQLKADIGSNEWQAFDLEQISILLP